MNQKLIKGLLAKKLIVKKGGMVTGSVCIHFPDASIEDIVLKDQSPVDVFQRINISADAIKQSNLSDLVSAGHVVIL
jgi:hypothetical protein